MKQYSTGEILAMVVIVGALLWWWYKKHGTNAAQQASNANLASGAPATGTTAAVAALNHADPTVVASQPPAVTAGQSITETLGAGTGKATAIAGTPLIGASVAKLSPLMGHKNVFGVYSGPNVLPVFTAPVQQPKPSPGDQINPTSPVTNPTLSPNLGTSAVAADGSFGSIDEGPVSATTGKPISSISAFMEKPGVAPSNNVIVEGTEQPLTPSSGGKVGTGTGIKPGIGWLH